MNHQINSDMIKYIGYCRKSVLSRYLDVYGEEGEGWFMDDYIRNIYAYYKKPREIQMKRYLVRGMKRDIWKRSQEYNEEVKLHTLYDDNLAETEDYVHEKMHTKSLIKMIKRSLTEVEFAVIMNRAAGYSWREIGEMNGFSGQRAQQIGKDVEKRVRRII